MSVLLKTFLLVLRHWPYYLLFCALDIALINIGFSAISQWNLSLSMSFVAATSLLWLGFSFFVLRASVLRDQRSKSSPNGKKTVGTFLPFVAKNLVLYLISFAICAPIFFTFVNQVPLDFFPDPATFGTASLFALVFFAGVTIIFSTVFALLGTWLPATVYGVNPLFSQALTRGTRAFWRSLFRIMTILIMFPLISWSMSAVTIAYPPLFPVSLLSTLSLSFKAVLEFIINAVFITLMMVALSENYFDGEGLSQVGAAPVSLQ